VGGDDLLFVYGTLMRGFSLHPLLEGQAAYLGEGATPGLLFDLGPYPAALKSATGKICGEIYRLLDLALWRVLDSAEGSQYHREEAGIERARGGPVRASMYWYVGPLDRAIPIPGGDYRAHAPARSIHHR
jgi:gamma-glutamylcyclotransferase (GGCT)/AIG2-like uncharacterized protein YtfP